MNEVIFFGILTVLLLSFKIKLKEKRPYDVKIFITKRLPFFDSLPLELMIKLGEDFMNVGWGNGYAVIHKNHPYYGRHYDNINIDVHGGLTYGRSVEVVRLWKSPPAIVKDLSDDWVVIGFDTAHAWDTIARWPESEVLKETQRMQKQLTYVK